MPRLHTLFKMCHLDWIRPLKHCYTNFWFKGQYGNFEFFTLDSRWLREYQRYELSTAPTLSLRVRVLTENFDFHTYLYNPCVVWGAERWCKCSSLVACSLVRRSLFSPPQLPQNRYFQALTTATYVTKVKYDSLWFKGKNTPFDIFIY